MFKQDFQKTYLMINPSDRFIISSRINNKELVSECITGKKQQWWFKKHNPDNEIPKNIYLLGHGTIKELYDKYIIQFGFIEWDDFIDYTRELIKQNIML